MTGASKSPPAPAANSAADCTSLTSAHRQVNALTSRVNSGPRRNADRWHLLRPRPYADRLSLAARSNSSDNQGSVRTLALMAHPQNLPPRAPILDGDGHGGRAVSDAADLLWLDIEAVNRLLEAHDLPPIEPEGDGVIALDSAGHWRYRPVGVPNRREPGTLAYERTSAGTPVPTPTSHNM